MIKNSVRSDKTEPDRRTGICLLYTSQALLIGVFAYLGRNQVPWLFGTTGGFYCVGRPLVAGAIVGLILGDVTTGVLCGVAVQAMYLGQIVAGGAMPSDVNYAAFIGMPLAMVAGGGAEAAIALAIPLGALGTAMHNFCLLYTSSANKVRY